VASELIEIEDALAADVAEGQELSTAAAYLDTLRNECRKQAMSPRFLRLVERTEYTVQRARGYNGVSRGHRAVAHALVAEKRLG